MNRDFNSLKPVLKWPGGKRQLLSDITPLIPYNPTVYVEPFIGGGAVLLDYRPEQARINDYNEELINVYLTIRDNTEELLDILKIHEEKDSKEYYYEIRALDRDESFKELSNVQRAARILYINKTCFNGLFRVNRSGQLNTAYGNYKNPNIVNEECVQALADYLSGDIEISCGDYVDTLRNLPEGSFVYLDPPYMPISDTSSFTHYTQNRFGYDEQVRLRDECVKLREQGIGFLQSNSDCKEIRELYDGFDIRTVKANRVINVKGDGRGAINEVLISS